MPLGRFLTRIARLLYLTDPAPVRPAAPAVPVFPPLPVPPAASVAAMDAWLDQLSAYITACKPPAQPSILITGAMRCGKTLVALDICQRTGMVHIPADRVRNATYLDLQGEARTAAIDRVYKTILRRHPTGVVVEGTVFLDRDVSLPLWAKRKGLQTFVIGYAIDDAKRKARSMISFRRKNSCWTKGVLTNAEVQRAARKIVAHSKDIRARCQALGLTYHDLDCARFPQELRRVRRAIVQEMGVRRRATPPQMPDQSGRSTRAVTTANPRVATGQTSRA